MSEITCRYCNESSEDKDMIEMPLRKVINGELLTTVVHPMGRKQSEFMCLECLKSEIENYDGRWPNEW
ncbi:hypothetical protein L1N85_10840 [Paenibacillus alkaliterrae]|uniref:hypothetical protein n=1 Tax=Paenibacillus alkaliterrae TaxID=320909 RepID=UPI001F3E450D|nr:hypothetical protein [Paenibacillus alkaliterrae]MCF2938932.1 hypothetical protein [Paenibacillus alkaliterrae]